MPNYKMLAAGIGSGIIVTGVIAGTLLGQGMQNRAITAAHPITTPTRTISLPRATITAPPLPRATITKTLPQATKTITPRVLQCPGHSEDSCYPDYIGGGRWVLREGEPPRPPVKKVPRASNRVPGATIAGVCRNPRITRDMVADCNKLAHRAAEVTANYSNPKGEVLVRECLDSYDNAQELKICLQP